MERSPSGEQWTITHGRQALTVVQVGGGLRSYAVAGLPVLAGFAVDETIGKGRGQLLMPWPNRVRDGCYTFDGVERQLALTEPGRRNASHGLVRWALWELEQRTETAHSSSLTVSYPLHPQPGWDWHLDLRVTYVLTDVGLTVETSATNTGRGEAPFGYGAHPYLAVGGATREEVVLEVPAGRWLDVDAERLLPQALRDVDGTDKDFRTGRAIGDTELDTAFTGLRRVDGRWTIRLGRPDGEVHVWAGPGLGWAQVFTGTLTTTAAASTTTPGPGAAARAAGAARSGRGVAIEPMSCPPDAFNSGTDLVRITPGEMWTAQWGITPAW